MTIFDEYRQHPECRSVSPALLWDVDAVRFDYQRCRLLVVQRVVEMGLLADWWAMYHLYGGAAGVRGLLKEVPHLSPRALALVCSLYGLRKEELRCHTRRRSTEDCWPF